ncbi:Ferredoxin [bioreactor metagenome]|uniref:Ferredoxin n=1 Tax=bioreactor metagenome TaxID=1076179 RepID=A0A645HIM2_9ZZZZ
MKAIVDRDGCIGCGVCAATCPEVFDIDDENLAKVICDEIPSHIVESASEARDACPVSVISLED